MSACRLGAELDTDEAFFVQRAAEKHIFQWMSTYRDASMSAGQRQKDGNVFGGFDPRPPGGSFNMDGYINSPKSLACVQRGGRFVCKGIGNIVAIEVNQLT